MPSLPYLRIHQETEPEGLQHPENESLGSVEKTETEKVTVEEQKERAEEKRHPIVSLAQKALALRGIAASIWL